MALQTFKVYVNRDTTGLMPDMLSCSPVAGTRCFETYVAVGPLEIQIDVPPFGTEAELTALQRRLAEEEEQRDAKLAEIKARIAALEGGR